MITRHTTCLSLDVKKKSNAASVSQVEEASAAAKEVGLRYVTDTEAGFSRKGTGSRVQFVDAEEKVVRDRALLERLRSLVIPPAWTKVWICRSANGHLQATGRDARGRKQHIYHRRWREVRDENKFSRMISFGRAVPKIRRRVSRDLRRRGLTREKVLATVTKLLEVSLIRVGNEEYARQNHSFGLTTMRDRHVDISGSRVRFRFRGKRGIEHDIDVNDAHLAKVVRDCQDLPGQELFQYLDEDGQRQTITSEDVNQYLRSITGSEFTAKDFRTWAGTVLAALALQEFEKFDSKTQAKKNVVQAIEKVAERLGNTPSICRKCYIHPTVIESYLDGSLLQTVKQRAEQQLKKSLHGLPSEEAAVLALLQQRLAAGSSGKSLGKQLKASLRAVRRKGSEQG